MKNRIFYTEKKRTHKIDSKEVLTGYKTVVVFMIIKNNPVILATLSIENDILSYYYIPAVLNTYHISKGDYELIELFNGIII